MIDMEGLDTTDCKSKVLLLKKRLLKLDELYQEHAQLQKNNEALINECKLIEEKEKETSKLLQKYVNGCVRLMKENESQRKEMEKLRETMEEKISSMEMLKLENEKLNGALKMFEEQRKFLHETSNCPYKSDKAFLIKHCYDAFKYRLKTDKISNMYKYFQKRFEQDLETLKLKAFKIVKVRKRVNIKSEDCDSELSDSMNDFLEEVKPLDSVESGYHENDSVIESTQSKSDCKLDQDFEIQEGISLNETWSDENEEANDLIPVILIDNDLMDINATCTESVPDFVVKENAVNERPKTPLDEISGSKLPYSPEILSGKTIEGQEIILKHEISPAPLSPSENHYSLYISPVKEGLINLPEVAEEGLPIENKPLTENNSSGARRLSFSPDSSPVKSISIPLNNLKTYGKKRRKEDDKIIKNINELENLGKQIEKNIMGVKELNVVQKLVEVTEKETLEENLAIELGEGGVVAEVEVDVEVQEEVEENLVQVDPEVEIEVQTEQEKVEEMQNQKEDKAVRDAEKLVEVEPQVEKEVQTEQEKVKENQSGKEVKIIGPEEKQMEEDLVVQEKHAEEEKKRKKNVDEPAISVGEQVQMLIKEVEVTVPDVVEGKQEKQISNQEIQKEEISDDELANIFKEMKMPTLLSPLSITPVVLNHEIKEVKNEKKNKKAKKKKVKEDEKEWCDALYAVLSLKKKDKIAKAILEVLKKTREEEKVKKKKKAKKKKKSSWEVEELKEEKSSEDEKNRENSPNKKNYATVMNVPDKISEISGEEKALEINKNVLAEISTQTEVNFRQTNLPNNQLREIFQRMEHKSLSSQMCTQTETSTGLPELSGNCLDELLPREVAENDCEIVLDLSQKSFAEESSENTFNKVLGNSKEEIFNKSEEINKVEKAEVSQQVHNENSNDRALDLRQKNPSEEIPEHNFEHASQTASNLDESMESPLKSFPEEISENEYLDEFLQDALETCLTEGPNFPTDLEKSLLDSSTNYSENEVSKDSAKAEICTAESPESPKAEDKGLTESASKNSLESNHLFSENISSDDSEENRLRIASDEVSEKSSSPSIIIQPNFKLISPIRVKKYMLRSSSLSPGTLPEPPFPKIKFIDTSPFYTYDLAFRNYQLNEICDISDSSENGLPGENSLKYSPITRNSRQRYKRKGRRRSIENDLELSSATENESESLPLSALLQRKKDNAGGKSVEESSQVNTFTSEESEDSSGSNSKPIKNSSSEGEEESSKEVPQISDSDSSTIRDHSPITRQTRQRQKRKRKRRKIENDSDSSSEVDMEDPKKMSLSALIQEREDKAAKALIKSSQLEAQPTEKVEDSVSQYPVDTSGSGEAISTENIITPDGEPERIIEEIKNSEEETLDIRPKRTLAGIRDSVLRATRSLEISENLIGNSTRSRKRRRVENSSENQVEVCGSCLGRCFHKCKRKIKVTNDVQIRLLRNMTQKESPAPSSELQIDIAPEMAVSSGSDNEKRNQKDPEETLQKENGFELDSILTAMTKQKEEFKSTPRKVAILMPGPGGQTMQYVQMPGMQASGVPGQSMQALGIPGPFMQLPAVSVSGGCNQTAPEVSIDWKSICDNMNIENHNSINENVQMEKIQPEPEEKTRFKRNLKGKKLDDCVKMKLEIFVNSNMETNEQAKNYAEKCLSYLLTVPEDVVVKETVELVLENVDEDIIVFEKPAPPLTKTQHRLLVILSLLQKTSSKFQTLIPSILKLINQKLFPEKFFWPDDSVESASRFFAALCKHENNFQAIWKFCYNALTEMHQRFSIVIHSVLLVWPDILHRAELIKSNLLTTTFVTLILQTPRSESKRKELKFQQMKLMSLKEMLRLFYRFETNNTLDSYLKDLMSELVKGTEKSEESLKLFVKCKTFEWLSSYFVPKILEYLNSWAERKIENDVGIKFLNLLKLMGNKIPVSKNVNAKVSKLITCLMEILSSGKMNHSEEEEIVEVLISFPIYVKVGEVLAKWNTSDISQNLQEKISKAVKEAQKPARWKQPQKPKPKVDKIVNSKKEINRTQKKRKKGGKKHKKKKSENCGTVNKQ